MGKRLVYQALIRLMDKFEVQLKIRPKIMLPLQDAT